MDKTVPKEGSSVPRPGGAGRAFDRLASFRFIYLAIFSFLVLWVVSVGVVESALDAHFHSVVTGAVEVDPSEGDLAQRIYERVDDALRSSVWTRTAGVEVVAFVTGADGLLIYPGGPPPEADPMSAIGEADRLLPVEYDVAVSVPYNAVVSILILVIFGAAHVQALFIYNRRLARREEAALDEAVRFREQAASRARGIEVELWAVRRRLEVLEPAEGQHAVEIRDLRAERSALQTQLAELTAREEKLRNETAQAAELDSERRTLEELLDEALEDLGAKDEEIQSLQTRLKRAARQVPVKSREVEQLERRLRTLYKNLEIDDRAIRGLIALRDEGMKLKAEESLKRLSDDADNAAVRRKVGGLPPTVPIFELGFAGKGRIYYTPGQQRRHRILAVGAKNSQKTDLEYLHRIAKGLG